MSAKPGGASILVVDDEPGILRAVQRILEREHHVTCAASAAEALDLIKSIEPDVAILDILMPKMSGFDLMRKLAAARPEMDFLLMTGNPVEADENLIRAIQQGAFYFVQKPFDGRVLRTLVARCLELRDLRLAKEEYVRHLEEELAQARRFQESLLPPSSNTLGEVAIAASYQACEALAGDLYDYAAIDDRSIALLLADVSGHGARAAMLTGIVKSAFHAARAESYRPLAVVKRVAEAMRSFELHRFVSLFCAVIDTAANELHYVSAGHPPALLGQPGDAPAELESTGPIISPGLPPLDWEQKTIDFEPGCRLVVYSDGVPEARGNDGPFGYQRLTSAIAGAQPGAGWVLHEALDQLQRFIGQRPLEDDLTILVAERGAEREEVR